ncbi:MAG: polysulfide reductase NrfD [Acidimicrobiia bacterium]|nr:MAG: polysulfide reductase NrfD [Acidimicrobiia bacterium]
MTSHDTRTRQLPQGVGRLTGPWWAFIAIASAVLLFGVYAYWRQASGGLGETALADTGTMGGATWGLYVVMVEYFIGVSFAGVAIAALARVFHIADLKPVTRIAELLTVGSLLVGLAAVLIDLGHPARGLWHLLLYARPQSAFFATFTLVGVGLLLASLVYLFLGGRRDAAIMATYESRLNWYHRWWASGYTDTGPERERHMRAMFWLSIGIVPLLVVSLSTEGLVFGLQVGRPGWFGSMQAPDFLVLAAASGVANLIVLAAMVRRALGKAGEAVESAFPWLGRILLAAALAGLYFMVVEMVSLLYATPADERLIAEALLTGVYAPITWLSFGLMLIGLAILTRLAAKRAWHVGPLVLASVLVSISAFAERYLTVVPSQTHGMLLPYEIGAYFPNWLEIAVGAGLFALGALLIGLFIKVFPAIPMTDEEEVSAHA